MTTSKSISMIVAAADQVAANQLMRALGRDDAPDPGKTFTVGFNGSGLRIDAVTHYGAHTRDDDLAGILDSGVLPSGIDWRAFGLTRRTAGEALVSIRYSVVADNRSRVNFNQELTDSNLKTRDSGIA